MRDSERDHNTVVEVLSAFIREHARKEDAAVNGAEGEGEATAVVAGNASWVIFRRRWRCLGGDLTARS